MPAHLRPLPRCRTCDAPATVELRNTYNASLGCYCARHGNAALKAHEKGVAARPPVRIEQGDP